MQIASEVRSSLIFNDLPENQEPENQVFSMTWKKRKTKFAAHPLKFSRSGGPLKLLLLEWGH
jgi:hypothetical protein